MQKILNTILLSLLFTAPVMAQSLKGKLTDEQGKPVSDATVLLLQAKDSLPVMSILSKDGNYFFKDVKPGHYLLKITHIGYVGTFTEIFEMTTGEKQLHELLLAGKANNLQAVTVKTQKKLIDVKAAKTIIQVAGTMHSSSAHALEVLRKMPGITVDKDDNLLMQGKPGVQVLVDNRVVVLTAEQLAGYLKSIPADQIESIELLNQPGAIYDASGSGGIIHIRLKKNKSFGVNGSVQAGMAVTPRVRYNGSFSLNYRNRGINLFSDYSFQHNASHNKFRLNRQIGDTAFFQQNDIKQSGDVHLLKAGADFTLSSRSVLGITITGNLSDAEANNNGSSPIVYVPSGATRAIMQSVNASAQQQDQWVYSLNYQYRDSAGNSLNMQADRVDLNIRNKQDQPNRFVDPVNQQLLYTRNYALETPSDIRIYTLKADYEKQAGKHKWSFGGKSSFVQTDNNFHQYAVDQSDKTFDHHHSNAFAYREQVHATYAQWNFNNRNWAWQTGVRAEYTNIKGDLFTYHNSTAAPELASRFSRNYFDLFPSLSVTMAPGSKSQWTLAYSRRIDRPVYKDLNPFEYRINEYTFHKGSIDLKPQYAQSISLTHTYGFRLNTTLTYSRTTDMFGQVADTAAGVKGYLYSRNIARQDMLGLNISYPLQYGPYSLFTNVHTYYASYRLDDGPGRKISLDRTTFSLFMQHGLRFAKTWTAELSGFYNSPSVWQGSLRAGSIWSMDAGIQKQWLAGRVNLKLSISDLFKTLKWTAEGNFAGQSLQANGSQDSRQFRIQFGYRFGNSKVKAARQTPGGAEEERKRTQGAAGLGG